MSDDNKKLDLEDIFYGSKKMPGSGQNEKTEPNWQVLFNEALREFKYVDPHYHMRMIFAVRLASHVVKSVDSIWGDAYFRKTHLLSPVQRYQDEEERKDLIHLVIECLRAASKRER